MDALHNRVRFDRAALAAELKAILGRRYVKSHPTQVLVYEQDASVFRSLPDLVALPDGTDQVAAVVRACTRHGAPIIPRGAGTGLAGGAVPATGGVVVSTARMNRILDLDLESRVAVVQPGLVNLKLTHAASGDGLFFAPDPSSQSACSIGGNAANNSGGVHTLSYGVTTNHVLGLEVVLPDGRPVRLGSRASDAPGLDLVGLFVGSEGTLGIITEVTCRLLRRREDVRTLLAVFETVRAASEAVSGIIATGLVPQALEMMDALTIHAAEAAVGAGLPLDAGAVLLVELEGLTEEMDPGAAAVTEICRRHGAREVRLAADARERDLLWAARKGAFGAMGRLAPDFLVQDCVVPRSRLPEVIEAIGAAAGGFGVRVANVFHAGDGNLHPNILFDARVPGEIDRVLKAGEEIVRICIEAGGTLSGEHGVGLEKNAYMEELFGPETIGLMKALKAAVDPGGLMNPEKVLPSPVSCGELTGKVSPARLAAAGLWV